MIADYGACRDCGRNLALVGHHPNTGQCHPCWMAERSPHPECAFYGHSPNAAGTECELCGLAAEPGDPDETAEALIAAYETLVAQVPGQTQWLD